MAPINKNSASTQFERQSFRKDLGKYLKYWPWFLLWLLLSFFGAFFYLRYATPIYRASASFIISGEDSKDTGSEMASYSNLGLLNGLKISNIDNELAILRSRRLMKDVVSALRVNIQFFINGSVQTIEIYDNLPFSLKVLRIDDAKLKELGQVSYAIKSLGNSKLQLRNLKTEKIITTEAGGPTDLGFGDVVIVPDSKLKNFSEIIVRFSDGEKVASEYMNKIMLIQAEKSSNVIELALEDPVKEKAMDIIDQLIFEFNRDAMEDKNLIAGNTANFINERLDIINDELESVESGKEEFKETNRLTDIQAESQIFMQSASEYNKRRQEVGTQMELSRAVLEYLTSSSSSQLLPANLGIEQGGVNQQINEYNNLVLERNRILAGSSDINPVVVRLNSRIDQIKTNIRQSLQRLLTNLQIAQDDLRRQSSSIGSRIMAVPSQEREYRGIERQQGIKETLYLFLLQKREENSLALAVIAPKAKVIDRAYSTGGIVSPNPRNIYLGAMILGLFIPFTIVYLKDLLNNKIRMRADLENLEKNISIVGELPRIKRNNELIIEKNDRSVLAESFRILITNLQYLLVNSKDKSKGVKIFVTSTVKGEGKTFTVVNLGITLANTGKKTLLVGADLRNPKLSQYMEHKTKLLGVTDYLVDDSLALDKLIGKSKLHTQLDLLSSGSIPPNPYELLKQEKIGAMFTKLEGDYDYIIIDTAPSMLVADTFLITKYADLILYVVRAGFTEKELLKFPLNAKEEGKLQNVSFVLNDVNPGNLGYGNKYGYGYAADKPGFWNRLNFAPQ